MQESTAAAPLERQYQQQQTALFGILATIHNMEIQS